MGYDAVQNGLVCGSGGSLSARMTDEADPLCWVTADGSWLDRLSRSTFAAIRIDDGTPIAEAKRPAPSVKQELQLHLTLYRARPDVNAIVRLQPRTALLLDALGERIRLVTADQVKYLGRVSTVPFREPGSGELAALTAAMAADGTNCLVLSRQGCVLLADSVELAHLRARHLEEAAELTYRALALGRLDVLTGSEPLPV
ncbi:class II aldolase/adducin family protein [Actinoplanes sp. NPDC051494]|uniref:class II aldolase/adducin family protein n=1 Tax=Actinoplanes sp. NPDC051494 TaxID=3363907 RepID=UPI0037B97BB9